MNEKQSFLEGFRYGKTRNARELSSREIEVLFPKVHVASFAQGMLDSLAGDEFRFNELMKENMEENIGEKFRKNPAALDRLMKALESIDLVK